MLLLPTHRPTSRRRSRPSRRTLVGAGAMLVTALLWSLTVIGPVLVPDASPSAIVGGRFAVLGIVAVVVGRARVRRTRDRPRDAVRWRLAFRLAFLGMVGFYLLLVAGIRLAGPAPVAVVLGSAPALYALAGARRERLPARPLLPALGVMVAGLLVANVDDVTAAGLADLPSLALGLVLAAVATAMWIRYGLDNAAHLKARGVDTVAWTSTLGMAAGALSLPLLAHGLLTGGVGQAWGRWLVVVIVLGAGSAWLGTAAFSVASRLLPSSVVGPLLVMELVTSLAYAHGLAGTLPSLLSVVGYAVLALGVAATLVRIASLRRGGACEAPAA